MLLASKIKYLLSVVLRPADLRIALPVLASTKITTGSLELSSSATPSGLVPITQQVPGLLS